MREQFRIAVLISGSGSNLQAIIDQLHIPTAEPVEVVLVVSSRADAVGLERAERADIRTAIVALSDYVDRDARDQALADVVAAAEPALVVLAGFMSILGPEFLGRFPDRVINVHPSLLPAFVGLHAVEQALEWGARVTGVTVHYADAELDSGPPILQEAVAVHASDDAGSLAARIHAVEHRLVPEAVRLMAAGRVRRHPERRRVVEILEDPA